MQIALGLRRQAPQLLGPRRAVAQLRDQRFGAGDHGGIGALVRVRPGGLLASAFDQHLPSAFLAIAARALNAADRSATQLPSARNSVKLISDPRGQRHIRQSISHCRSVASKALDRSKLLGDCLSPDHQLRRGARCPSIEFDSTGTDTHGQDRWNRRAWHHGRRDRPQSGRARMARDRLRYRCRQRTPNWRRPTSRSPATSASSRATRRHHDQPSHPRSRREGRAGRSPAPASRRESSSSSARSASPTSFASKPS